MSTQIGFNPVIVRQLGLVPYAQTWEAMRTFTERRGPDSPDEIWVLEHPSVYTLGRNGRELPHRHDIPLVHTDRGGDITYHGPGQAVVYVLIDLRRRRLGIRELVDLLEQSVIDWLQQRAIEAQRRAGAPGVYVTGRKIASLGLRIRGGCSYHGIALNVAMDTAPFASITPCGLEGMSVVQVSELLPDVRVEQVGLDLAWRIDQQLHEKHQQDGP